MCVFCVAIYTVLKLTALNFFPEIYLGLFMSLFCIIYMCIGQKALHNLSIFLCSMRVYQYSFETTFSAVEITSLNNLFPLSLNAPAGLMTICGIANPTVKQ